MRALPGRMMSSSALRCSFYYSCNVTKFKSLGPISAADGRREVMPANRIVSK